MLIPYLDNRYSNTYVVGEKHKYCFLFDPSDVIDIDFIDKLRKEFKELKAVFLTHGHYDHFGSLNLLSNEFPKVKIYIFETEKEFLNDQNLNFGKCLAGKSYEPFNDLEKVLSLKDKEEIEIENHKIKLFHTPFHTSGSSIYFIKNENSIISGDTLFIDSIGRCDLPTGDNTLIEQSLKVFSGFKDDVMVYPGHGNFDSLKNIKKINPYLSK